MLPAARQFDCLSIDQFEEEPRRFAQSRLLVMETRRNGTTTLEAWRQTADKAVACATPS